MNLNDVISPDDVVKQLLDAAQRYHESASELSATWQDPCAGKIWTVAARELERAAAKIQREWEKV